MHIVIKCKYDIMVIVNEREVFIKEVKFIFPDGTNEVLIKWFNDIYREDFTSEETKIVWENISKHTEIKEISSQIWGELKTLCEYNEAWKVY